MSTIKKNKIHNPQLVTDSIPQDITHDDLGRMWVDTEHDGIYIAIKNKVTGIPELRSVLDSSTMSSIDGTYFSSIEYLYGIIEPQIQGDKHFDNGFDFFGDPIFIANSTQNDDDFYSFYYPEVTTSDSFGYVRSISTDSGIKHVRPAIGTDTYTSNSITHNLVNYSKILLPGKVKAIIDITFDNKDSLETGFELMNDKQTILIYADPEGFFINKMVKIRYVI